MRNHSLENVFHLQLVHFHVNETYFHLKRFTRVVLIEAQSIKSESLFRAPPSRNQADFHYFPLILTNKTHFYPPRTTAYIQTWFNVTD